MRITTFRDLRTGSGCKRSAYAPLVGALHEQLDGIRPAIDFAAPRQPPAAKNPRNRVLAIAAGVALVLGAGWFYVQSQFTELEQEQARLQNRLAEVSELVKKSRGKRNTAKLLARWEKNRMTWLDELRDLTVRMPASSELSISQLSAGPSGSGYQVSFQGTSRSPDAIRNMENSLRDEFHESKTPGIREVGSGKSARWSFQTTLRIRSRPRSSYRSHINSDNRVADAGTVIHKGTSTRRGPAIRTVSQEEQR